ncbi:MAG: Gfo/Idh/MocA family oxidoreductase [Armatimonadota bacterium]
MIKVGIIGLKGHQSVAIAGINKREDCRLAAVCDDDEKMLAAVSEWAAADEDTRTFTDYGAMLDEVELDFVVEAGTDNLRGDIIRSCARRGIHVLAEKPLAFTLQELEHVRAAVENGGIDISMLLTMRYDPIYLGIKQVVESGALGTVCLATMQKSYRLGNRPQWQRSSETFSGIIPFIGIHALDLIWYTSGLHFTAGAGFQGNIGHPEIRDMEDSCCLAVEMSNGASAAVRMDYCRPEAAPTHGDDRLRLAGNQAVVEALHCGESVTLIDENGENDVELPEGVDQFSDFVDSIGDGECLAPAEDCFYMTEVVLRLKEAVQSGTVASLPQP